MSQKLQKILANQGLGSRRTMEKWISDGRIRVNGEVAALGDRVEEDEDTFPASIAARLRPLRGEANND